MNTLSEVNFAPGKLPLNRVHRDDFPDPFKYPNFATKHYIILKTLKYIKIHIVSENKRNIN